MTLSKYSIPQVDRVQIIILGAYDQFVECFCFSLGKIVRMKIDAQDDLILYVSHQYVLWHIVNYVHSANSDFHFDSESH